MHDATVSRELFQKLIHETEDGYYLIADTAIPSRDALQHKIKTPLKSNFTAWPEDPVESAILARTNKQLVSARQAAEWGMRSLQGSFETCCRIHQLRVRLLGISEIRSKYEPIWNEADEGVYSNFGNMLFGDIAKFDRISQFYNRV
ncbi:hypothetical protein V1507DRAFT_445417 [Lipomyces tetrasporus]